MAASEMARFPDGVGWKVTARLNDHHIETWCENGSGRQVKIDEKPAPQVALGQLSAVVWLTPAMDRLWTEGADGRRRFLDRIAMSFRPGHGEAALVYEKAMRERNRLLKEQVTDAHWYGALEAQMAGAGARIDSGRRDALEMILAAQAGAETAFPRADLALVGPDGTDALIWTDHDLAAAFAASRNLDLKAGRTLVGPHRADLHALFVTKGTRARDTSTGEQKALLISIILANARALINAGRGAPILLLDEIAAHLDEDRRESLYQEILAVGAQAWMTGTGAEMFEPIQRNAQFLSIRDEGGVSRVESEN